MRASLDTNAIIHFYRAGLQNMLFDFFDEGVFIYEQIRNIELENHGQDVLAEVDKDIASGRIMLYTDDKLRQQAVYKMFEINVRDNRHLYDAGDLGEVYAISLAQTIGAYAIVTDDTKQRGPYMSLLQFEDDIIPLNFADILIVHYLIGYVDALHMVEAFQHINTASNLNWSLKAQLEKFIRRFFKEPYKMSDREWIDGVIRKNKISLKSKLIELRRLI